MGIRAEDTYFKPLEEIGTHLSKDRALTLFRDILEHPLALWKNGF